MVVKTLVKITIIQIVLEIAKVVGVDPRKLGLDICRKYLIVACVKWGSPKDFDRNNELFLGRINIEDNALAGKAA